MAIPLSAGPFQNPAVKEDGRFTQPWVIWLTQLYQRAGGPNAASLSEIQSELLTAQENISALQTTAASQAAEIATLQNAVNGLNVEPS